MTPASSSHKFLKRSTLSLHFQCSYVFYFYNWQIVTQITRHHIIYDYNFYKIYVIIIKRLAYTKYEYTLVLTFLDRYCTICVKIITLRLHVCIYYNIFFLIKIIVTNVACVYLRLNNANY